MANEFKSGYALSIGIGAYKYLSSLTKSPTDAQDIADLLIQQCGYPAGQVAALIDARATKATISAKFEWLARRTTEQDTVVIFFSGHGVQRVGSFEPGEYLCPVETDVYNLRATAISSEEFSTALRAIPARKIVVFFDACHSGGVGEVKEAELQMKAGLSSQQYRRLAEGNGRVIIASCKPDEVSWEVKDMHNGLFTHYLLEGLRGEAAETNGEVSIFDLFQYTAKKVKVHGQQLGITQTPWFKAETEDFVVAMVQDLTKTTPAIDWEETMIGISSDLLYQLRNTLGRCQAFATNEALKSVFTDARLSLWAGSVPETNTSDERINQTITFLYKQENIHDENGLALLLRVLAEPLSANDKLRRKLEALADEIEGKASPPAPPPTPVNWSQFANSLREILCQIPALDDIDNRSALLSGLPPGPVHDIRRSSSKNDDLRRIVDQAKWMGKLISGEQALVIVAQNALQRVKGIEAELHLRALIDDAEIEK